MKTVLSCRQLTKTYDQGPQPVTVLQSVELDIFQGERVAIIGNSGSGKSTLLNLLGGLDLPTSGSVEVAGQTLTQMNENQRGLLRNRHLGFVYQFHHLLGEFTALENVFMPLIIGKQPVRDAQNASKKILERVGLAHRMDHKPAELSGGERQRVAIARALVTHPDCVLMDEPTGNLDQDTAESVQALMWELNREYRLSFIVVTHDPLLAKSMDRILELKQGRLEEITAKGDGDKAPIAKGSSVGK